MRLIALFTVTLALAGCFTTRVYVEAKRPLITLPARPVLEHITNAQAAFTDPASDPRAEYERLYRTLGQVLDYTRRLEDTVSTYNTQAVEHNIKNGYTDAAQ